MHLKMLSKYYMSEWCLLFSLTSVNHVAVNKVIYARIRYNAVTWVIVLQ